MTSLNDLLSLVQQGPRFHRKPALVVCGLQNDFVSPNGKMPSSTENGFLDHIKQLVPIFREYGSVIWLRSEYRGDRPVNHPSGDGDTVLLSPSPDDGYQTNSSHTNAYTDGRTSEVREHHAHSSDIQLDEELFLTRTASREPCCLPDSTGTEFVPDIIPFIDQTKDMQIMKSYYSAFTNSNFHHTLRSKLIMELYFVGCTANLSVYATAVDAARHGLVINLVEDCLGYRRKERHDAAIAQLVDRMGAAVTTCRSVVSRFRGEEEVEPTEKDCDSRNGDVESADHSNVDVTLESSHDRTQQTPDLLKRSDPVEGQSDITTTARDELGGGAGVEEPTSASDEVRSPAQQGLSDTTLLATSSYDSISQAPTQNLPIRSEDHAMPVLIEGNTSWLVPTQDAGRTTLLASSAVSAPAGTPHTTTSSFETEVASSHDAVSDASNDKAGPSEVLKDSFLEPSASSMDASRQEQFPPAKVFTDSGPFTESRRPSSDLSVRTSDSVEPSKKRRSIVEFRDMVDSSHNNASGAGITRNDTSHEPGRNSSVKKAKRFHDLSNLPSLGPGDVIGAGDSSITYDFVNDRDPVFPRLVSEVCWQKMQHADGEVPRLVCCQGDIDPNDGSCPVYRHPSDYSLPLLRWSRSVLQVKREAERKVGHGLNHVLIQLYRGGDDYISEHTDKTLDIAPDSSIVNVSFGAQRTMRLRTKRRAKSKTDPREQDIPETNEQDTSPTTESTNGDASLHRTTQRIPMPHNSIFVMGLATNAAWLHGINRDKRIDRDRNPAELAYSGLRISLTFRYIKTFLSSDSRLIWGQGATSKTRSQARSTINGDSGASQTLINAFGIENQSVDFDWQGSYGQGSDVLHLKQSLPERELPMLFLSADEIQDLSVRLYMRSLNVSWNETPAFDTKSLTNTPRHDTAKHEQPLDQAFSRAVTLRDADTLHTEVRGSLALLLYLQNRHANTTQPGERIRFAAELELLTSRSLNSLAATISEELRLRIELNEGLPLLFQTKAAEEVARYLDSVLAENMKDSSLEQGRTPNDAPESDSQERCLVGTSYGIVDCYTYPAIKALAADPPNWSADSVVQRRERFRTQYRHLAAWMALMEKKEHALASQI